MCAGAYALGRPLTRKFRDCCFLGRPVVLLATPWVFAGYSQVGHYYDLKGFLRPPWIQMGICLMLLGLTGEHHSGVHIFGNRIVVGLGLISYSIYLWHVPILELLPTVGLIPERTANIDVGWPRIIGTALPVVLLLSTLSYRVIERPFQESGKTAKAVERRRLAFGKFALAYPLLTLVVWAIALEAYLFLCSG